MIVFVLTLFFSNGEPARTFQFESHNKAYCETNAPYIIKTIKSETRSVEKAEYKCKKVASL
jgi:hypothetical protein